MAKPPMFGTMFEDAARRKKEEKEKAMEENKTVDDGIPGQQSFEDHPEILPKTDSSLAAEDASSPTGEKDKPPATAEKSEKTKKKISQKKKAMEEKKEMTSFSIWASVEDISSWDRYGQITGKTRVELVKLALADYMRKHPVTDEQKQAYMQKMGLL